jgi:hypothetical protein
MNNIVEQLEDIVSRTTRVLDIVEEELEKVALEDTSKIRASKIAQLANTAFSGFKTQASVLTDAVQVALDELSVKVALENQAYIRTLFEYALLPVLKAHDLDDGQIKKQIYQSMRQLDEPAETK